MSRPWDDLVEGKAIRPSPSMVRLAERISSKVRSSLTEFMSKAAAKGAMPVALFLAELDNGVGGNYTVDTPYGERAFHLKFSYAHGKWERSGEAAHKRVIQMLNKDMVDAASHLKDGWNLTVTLGGETLTMLLARRDLTTYKTLKKSLQAPLSKKDIKDYANVFAKNLRSTLIHELTHISDPKLQPEYVERAIKHRTRHGFKD